MARASLTSRTLASDVVAQLVRPHVYSALSLAARALTAMAQDTPAIAVIVAGRSTLTPAAVRRVADLEGVEPRLTLSKAGGALTEET
ncbi:MAG: hypothetical protein ACI9KE_003425 [Polyangiales bacterium]|jgi:hypothetical protein